MGNEIDVERIANGTGQPGLTTSFGAIVTDDAQGGQTAAPCGKYMAHIIVGAAENAIKICLILRVVQTRLYTSYLVVLQLQQEVRWPSKNKPAFLAGLFMENLCLS